MDAIKLERISVGKLGEDLMVSGYIKNH